MASSPIILSKVTALSDALVNNHFTLEILNVPGGGNGQDLMIRNMTATLPQANNPAVEIPLHRHRIFQAGRRRYNGTFTGNFVDTTDTSILQTLYDWQAATVDPATGLPFPKANYQTVANVILYNASNQPAISRTFYGIWVQNVADHALDGNTDSLLSISVTFQYDYWMPVGVNV